MLAGRGVCSPDERATLLHFAKQIGAPVATTLRGGKDLFRGAPANLGIFGTFSSEATVQAIQRADCIVAVGASLNGYTTAEGSFLADKKVVHVDVDERALSHDYHVDQPVLGDGKNRDRTDKRDARCRGDYPPKQVRRRTRRRFARGAGPTAHRQHAGHRQSVRYGRATRCGVAR